MNRSFLFAVGLTMIVPSVFAQTAGRLDPGSEAQVARDQATMNREVQSARHDMEQGERQSWLNSMANLAKLRIKLAEAWQTMGMSPQSAKMVADAYNPGLAATMHHASLRGKSDEQVAQMLQAVIKEKHYLSANQLLIDYQRDRLKLGANAAPK